MPLNQRCLGRTYGPSTTQITDDAIRRFLDATLDGGPAYQTAPMPAPPTMAFLPCWPVIQEALADPELGAAPGQIIHGEQVMRFRRPVVAGDVLTTRGTITEISPKGRNERYVIHLETTDASGDVVVEQDNICISLGSAAPTAQPPGSGGNEGRTPPPVSAPPPEPDAVSAVDLPSDITTRYAAASGDDTALHLDDEEARRLGFPGIIVHGMCLLSIAAREVVSRFAGNEPGRIAELSVRFSRPVEPGTVLTNHYWSDGSTCTFESVTGDGQRALTNGRVVIRAS